MPAPSKSWVVITDSQVDSDSPLDTTLVTALRDDLIHLEEWLGHGYTAEQNHNHDGVNSKTVSAPYVATAVLHHVMNAKRSFTVGGNIYHVNDTEITTGATGTYAKVKEIRIGQLVNNGAGFRVSFDLHCTTGAIAYAKIYKNGIAIGTARETISTTYVTFSEDFTGINAGDLIQVYAFTSVGAWVAYIQNFRLSVNETITDNTQPTYNTL